MGCLDEEQSVAIGVSDTSGSGTRDRLRHRRRDRPHDRGGADRHFDINRRAHADRLPGHAAGRALPRRPFRGSLRQWRRGPGEGFVTAPAWTNQDFVGTLLSGHPSSIPTRNGLDTTDPDLDASYGAVGSHATADCATATGDCYLFRFQNITRPSQHWDTYFDETLTTSDPHHRYAKRWTVHAGLSFTDVSPSSGYYPFIEDIFHNRITGGCGVGIYCPTSSVTRAQMAVFLLKSKHGASFAPPSCSGHFPDVPVRVSTPTGSSSSRRRHHGRLRQRHYCPNEAVTRQQMSVFLLKARTVPAMCPSAAPAYSPTSRVRASSPTGSRPLHRRITVGCGATRSSTARRTPIPASRWRSSSQDVLVKLYGW